MISRRRTAVSVQESTTNTASLRLPPSNNIRNLLLNAKSPPVPKVPENNGGFVEAPHHNDVLCGRGGEVNSHPGNVHYLKIVKSFKSVYVNPTTKKHEKAHISAHVVSSVRKLNPPGRFLKQDDTGKWFEIGDEQAWTKSMKAFNFQK